jgi:hypothetical protein
MSFSFHGYAARRSIAGDGSPRVCAVAARVVGCRIRTTVAAAASPTTKAPAAASTKKWLPVATTAAGPLAGTEAKLVVSVNTAPHLWALTWKLVVTIGGDVSRPELMRLVSSLHNP